MYLNHPNITNNTPLPVDYATLASEQQNDAALQALADADPAHYSREMFPTENPQHEVICYRKEATDPWKIRIPDSLLAHTVNWYHMVLNHLGSKRLRQTIQLQMVHPHLSTYFEAAVRACRTCQQSKVIHQQYGHLPPREVRGNAWSDVAVDCIGPWAVTIAGRPVEFKALTVIDTVTNYCEII